MADARLRGQAEGQGQGSSCPASYQAESGGSWDLASSHQPPSVTMTDIQILWRLVAGVVILLLGSLLIIAVANLAHSEPYAAAVTWSDGTTEEICVPLGQELCNDPRWRLWLKPRDPRSGAHVTKVGPCVPKACVSARENCIIGYVGPRQEGYCR